METYAPSPNQIWSIPKMPTSPIRTLESYFYPNPSDMSENLCPNVIISSPGSLKSGKFIRRRRRSRSIIPPVAKSSPFDWVPDQVIILIFTKFNESQRKVLALVCKRWLRLQGMFIESVRVLNWGFLTSGRLIERFRDLRVIDLVDGCVKGIKWCNVVMSHGFVSIRRVGIDNRNGDELRLTEEYCFLSKKEVDKGLKVIACGVPRLRKLVTLVGTEIGLMSLAEGCRNLEELELYRCCDTTLCAIAAFENLRVLRLNGHVGSGCVTDMGLTILAQGCTFLMKLELSGCEGSYDGIKAIGQCCQMLEELIITDHKFDNGWLASIPYFQNLRSLSIQYCKRIDDCPATDEDYLSFCPSLVQLNLDKCHLRNSLSLNALFKFCEAVEEIAIHDCWGLTDDSFILLQTCRKVTFLSLEGCSLITTAALESVVLSMNELERLIVVSCKNIKNSELSFSLSSLFVVLQELKWMPDETTLLSSSFTTAVGQKGGKFFKK